MTPCDGGNIGVRRSRSQPTRLRSAAQACATPMLAIERRGAALTPTDGDTMRSGGAALAPPRTNPRSKMLEGSKSLLAEAMCGPLRRARARTCRRRSSSFGGSHAKAPKSARRSILLRGVAPHRRPLGSAGDPRQRLRPLPPAKTARRDQRDLACQRRRSGSAPAPPCCRQPVASSAPDPVLEPCRRIGALLTAGLTQRRRGRSAGRPVELPRTNASAPHERPSGAARWWSRPSERSCARPPSAAAARCRFEPKARLSGR